MTAQEVITLEQFRDIPIRCVIADGKPMIPVVDIANAVQMDRGNMSKLLKRNERLFDEYKGVVDITTPGGVQSLVCLTRDGVMGLLFKVDAIRSKDPEIQERIVEFQRWATQVLARESVPVDVMHEMTRLAALKPNPIDAINDQLDIAEIAIKRSGIPKEIAHSMAWTLAANQTGEDLTTYASYIKAQVKGPQPLQLPAGDIPKDQKEFESYFSLRKVCEIIKQSETRARNILESLNVICFMNGIWHVTKYGETFGYAKVFRIMPLYPYSTMERTYIKYTPAAIELLREELRRNGIK